MVVLFVENKYILPEDIINAVEDYNFAHLSLVKREKD